MYKERNRDSVVRSYFPVLALISILLMVGSPAWVEGGTVSVCTPPPSGMISWWSGDNNALDMIGSNNGTLVNGATYAPGMVGQAFSFNGSGDYVSVPAANNLALNRPLTALTNTESGNPLYVVDGNMSSYWWSHNNCWGPGYNYNTFMLDLGTPRTVGQLYFYPLQTSGYTIWTSDDASTWTERHTGSNPSGWVVPISIPVNGAYSARYIKYEGTNPGAWCAWVGIAEFQVLESIPDPTNITVDAWVKPASYQLGASIINKRTIGNVGGFTLEDMFDGTGRINFFVWVSGDWRYATSNVALPLNVWTHVAGTYDGNVIKVYFNGQEVGNASFAGTITPVAADLQIGRNIVSGATWNGLIDEVEVFDRALSVSEIAAIYNAGSAGKCRSCTPPPSDLVAWWRAEDNAFDSFDGNHGTMTNGATFANGKIGRAFSFDGIDDAISAGMLNNTALSETLPFSISAWINSSDTALYQVIAGNYMGEGGGIGNFSTYLSINAGNLSFAINQRQLADVTTSTALTTGWHFVTATYDGSVLDLYVDGMLKNSKVRDFSGSSDNTRGWYIGNFSPQTVAAHGFNSSFKGLIDEAAIFNRALSASEIAAIYNAGSAGQCTQQEDQLTLTVAKSGTGAGTVTATGINCGTDCSEAYGEGTVVTLTATPSTGSLFAGWSGDPDCLDGTVTMTADKTCNAIFNLAPDLSGSWTWIRKSGPDKRGIYKVSGSLSLSNTGAVPANNAVVNVYLSDNSTYEPGDTLIASLNYGSLKGKITKGKSFNLTTKKNPSGKYVIGVIDPSNIVKESNETNNSVLKVFP